MFLAFPVLITTSPANSSIQSNFNTKTNILLTKLPLAQSNRSRHPTHVLRVRIRIDTIDNALIETLVNQKQLEIIEKQLKQRNIPFHQIQDNKDGITIIVGPFHKANQLHSNQSRFNANFSTIIPQKKFFSHSENDRTFEHGLPLRVEAQEFDLAVDQG
ncbi:unnamed protein product [Didymodactylos carnosus]|uniref:Uncharacterized protein n=1 Tax=Didymodactylos carnosus TaxID=1234261 RepID=A0A814BKA4_9BILA|nr:unnamed protein product [Didymodactylos carnosus]CAF1050423.1 unnamed protein product [Didymodactylos carnosus]CAF3708855.1 unnamed protein product [Didymodactylos carnosus]CAF3817252.1 unnamed protein product [Didymodactylos carnosus]